MDPGVAQQIACAGHAGQRTRFGDLRARGLTAVEESALGLLTRGRSESYEVYIRRIALAPGRAGELARTVKLADLDDHLGHVRKPRRAPPYSWARRVLERPGVESFPALTG
jgi:hypothetical protein